MNIKTSVKEQHEEHVRSCRRIGTTYMSLADFNVYIQSLEIAAAHPKPKSNFHPTENMLAVNRAILAERINQNKKWGLQRHDPGKWLAILGEEFGEVCQAAQKPLGLTTTKPTDASNLYLELLHVSAVAAAWAEQIKEESERKINWLGE